MLLCKCMKGLAEFCAVTNDRKVALILDQACSNERVGKAVEKTCVPELDCILIVPDPNIFLHMTVCSSMILYVPTTTLTVLS